MQDRHLSESSAEEEEEDELQHEEEHVGRREMKVERSEPRLRRTEARSSLKESASGGGSSEDEGDTTVTMKSGPRPRRPTDASTTSNLRVGFNSLLNPEDRKADERVKEEL